MRRAWESQTIYAGTWEKSPCKPDLEIPRAESFSPFGARSVANPYVSAYRLKVAGEL